MGKRITDERLADLKQAHEEFEPFVDNAGDWMKEMHHHRAVLLQAVEAERKKVERLREEQDELGKAYYKMVRLADNLADDKRLLNQEADRKLARLVEGLEGLCSHLSYSIGKAHVVEVDGVRALLDQARKESE